MNAIASKTLGFTLVEVLIALTLFSVVLVMIFSGLHMSTKAWHASDRQLQDNDEQRLALNLIRRQLMETVPLIYVDGKENPVLFRGETEALYFVSRLPAHRGGGGLFLLSLTTDNALATGSEQQISSLMLNYQPVRAEMDFYNNDFSEQLARVVLARNIEAISFAYFGKKDADEAPAWHDEWIAEPQLPVQLRLRIVAERRDDYWPELFIALYPRAENRQPQLRLLKPEVLGQADEI